MGRRSPHRSNAGSGLPVQRAGGSSSATLTVTSPGTASSGSYIVTTTATDASAPSYYGSTNATYVISASNTSISITTDGSNYLPGQTVGITVAVSSGGSPVAGASVSVGVTPPSGGTNTLSGTTDSNGVASLSYNLKKQAPAGTYQAQAGLASKGHGGSNVKASTTFAVQ